MILRRRSPSRPADDVDLGPHAHVPIRDAPRGWQLTGVPIEADYARLRDIATKRIRRAERRAVEETPRCGHVMPKAGTTCARKAGHALVSGHKSRQTMDEYLLKVRAG